MTANNGEADVLVRGSIPGRPLGLHELRASEFHSTWAAGGEKPRQACETSQVLRRPVVRNMRVRVERHDFWGKKPKNRLFRFFLPRKTAANRAAERENERDQFG